jgi:murein DD-endopeptidase MepM/ murein hydrolase activator NlpD
METNDFRIISPVKNPIITSKYGYRYVGERKEFHGGIDIVNKEEDKSIICPVSGIIHTIGFSTTFGNRIWVKIQDNTFYVLAHLKHLNPMLKEGQCIDQCDYIGEMGETGISRGVHCHYEFRKDPQSPSSCFCSQYQKL